MRRGPRLAPRILGRDAGAVRAAFVPTQAGPLAGDCDRVRIAVGAGATLIVEPVAATLALPGPARTLLRLDVTVADGGRLVLDEAPLIVAAGAEVERHCTIELEEGAVTALRETVVLGRDGEPPGLLVSTLRATHAGRPLLHDGLRLGPTGAAAHVALPPAHRVVATLGLLGARAAPTDGVLALARPGALRRATGPSLAGVESTLAELWREWSQTVASAHARPRDPEPAGLTPGSAVVRPQL